MYVASPAFLSSVPSTPIVDMLPSVPQLQAIVSVETRLEELKDQLQSSAPSSSQEAVASPSPEDPSDHSMAVSWKHGARKKQTPKVRVKLPAFLGRKV